MKVITKCVNIESKEFYLISNTHEGKKYYGTIPYENTKNGVLIKEMNGIQMCISFNSPAEAIDNRKKDIVMNRILDRLEATGMNRMEAVTAMFETAEYKALYNEAV